MPDPPPGVVPSFNPVFANNTSTLTLDLGRTVQPEAGTYQLPICATIKDDPGKTCHAATYITLTILEPPPAAYELSITMTGSNDGSIQLGDTAFFDLTVQHHGADGATGIEVTDLLPDGLTFDAVESINKGTYTAGTGLWHIGTLPPNTMATLRIRTIAAIEGRWANTSTITAGLAPGDDPGNNEASVDITVVNDTGTAACADFDLRLDFNPIEVAAGGSDAVAVFIDRTTGFTGQVELTLYSVDGGPRWSDVVDTWAFSPNPVPGNTAASTLSFTMRQDVTQDDYQFGIAGGSPLLEQADPPAHHTGYVPCGPVRMRVRLTV